MKSKFEIFCDLAGKMNRKFSLIPMLYGSLGLQTLVEDELDPDDIDICVPQYLYSPSERWQELVAFMQGEGYELIDEHEHLFSKGDIEVNISAIDGNATGEGIPCLEAHAEIDASECPVAQAGGAVYRHLTLEQYLRVYTKSRSDEYRREKTGDKDSAKITAINRALSARKN